MDPQQKFEEAAKDIRAALDDIHGVLNEMEERGLKFTAKDYADFQRDMQIIYALISRLNPLAQAVTLALYANLWARLPQFAPSSAVA